MEKSYLLSLCIPTNGMTEWVLSVLDSIYASGKIDESKFEVVIEDNGNNEEFKAAIDNVKEKHSNLHYFKSEAQGFLCQIDSFKHARGNFIKFVNHRSRFLEGTLEYLINCSEKYRNERPVIFFSNGNLKNSECETFDDFVRELKHYSSWSGGLAFWKEDIELLSSVPEYNVLFPHTDMLFSRRDSKRYYILDRKLFFEIETGHSKKGKYNLFKAFGSDYPAIIQGLCNSGDITIDTFLSVKASLLNFLVSLYIDFIIKKRPASYSFDDYKKYLHVYYSSGEFMACLCERIIKKICIKSFKMLGIHRKS